METILNESKNRSSVTKSDNQLNLLRSYCFPDFIAVE